MNKFFLILFIALTSLYQPTRVVFNLPALKGKNMVQLRKILGKPKIDNTQEGTNGNAFFEKSGFTLEVTYNPVTNEVNDYFLSWENPVGNVKSLEAAGNLRNTKSFLITPVRSNRGPSMFQGITITPL